MTRLPTFAALRPKVSCADFPDFRRTWVVFAACARVASEMKGGHWTDAGAAFPSMQHGE